MTFDLSPAVDVFRAISDSVPYRAALVFYGAYPIAMACVWIVLSIAFARRREGKANLANSAPGNAAATTLPFVSVVIPAHREADTIGRTLEALLAVDYPSYEVIVVNDGSPDNTAAVVRRYVHTGVVRLLDKTVNEGKAMGLNDALPLCRGEIVVVLDADIVVTPGVLRALVPHFETSRVGAVTGNPRVANRGSLLRNLQTLEFASIVSVQRRAQRIWGRVLTVSGAIAAFRKTALVDVGLFSPDMATEDIDMTWKLQRRFWDVRYEPSAVVWMEVPPTLGELWKQRRRWARGLAQVLLKHRHVPMTWKLRRLWPVFWEGVLSIAWAYTFLALTTYWLVAHAMGFSPYGSSPIPSLWGMLTATACLTQLATGVLLDRRYDRGLTRYFPFAVLYPLVYWMLMSVISAIYTIDGLLRKRPSVQVWHIARVGATAGPRATS
jgi:biofilm PGA synthesis N-glycosyltransferase PgaC